MSKAIEAEIHYIEKMERLLKFLEDLLEGKKT